MKTAQDIKKIADILFVVFVIASIVMGIICAIGCGVTNEDLIAVGIVGGVLVIAVGIFVAWALKTLIRGFGELVENSAVIRENTAPAKAQEAPKAAAPITPAREPRTASLTSGMGWSLKRTYCGYSLRIGSIRKSPALLTPPPITMTSGSSRFTTLAIACER